MPTIDYKTFFLIVLMCAGIVFNILLYEINKISIIPAIIIATALMNLSFTAWHECAHGIFSNKNKLNHFLGWITSFFSVYPGYYARKREHLLHHKYEGHPEKDPVYPRVQTKPFLFMWMVLRTVIYHNPQAYTDLPLTRKEKALDVLLYACVISVIFVGYLQGFLYSLFMLWLVPRGIIFVVHAYYICYFPHYQKSHKGYKIARIVSTNWLIAFLTINQTYHGIHHLWPSIPWHKYKEIYKTKKEELLNKGIEL